MRSVRKSVDLPVNSGSSAMFATHGFTIPAKDFMSTSYLKLINKVSYLLWHHHLRKHQRDPYEFILETFK